jgi:hypothetical protein
MMFRPLSRLSLALALVLAGAGGAVLAQNNTANPVAAAPGASTAPSPEISGSFEVGGVDVDVNAKTADAARQGGWRLAQRKAWNLLAQRLTGHGGSLSDGALDGLVTGIVVENENIGPTRYVARLGVLFDRARSAGLLGVAAQYRRSAPMLVVPIAWSGGTGRTFERSNPWAEAWTRFRSGESAIDYVRVNGTGPDGLLLNVGQVDRRGRGWWRTILDQYGASDILEPEVRLRREWPGGPIVATFLASHGPDHQLLGQFRLRVSSADALDTLFDAGVRRLDQIYQQAFGAGELRTDAMLGFRAPKEEAVEATPGDNIVDISDESAAAAVGNQVSIQFDTPSGAAVNSAEAALRAIPNVRSATTTSLALGGVSVMRVSFDGDLASLRSALEARGWQVQEGQGVLRIRRNAPGVNPAPAQPPPPIPAPGDQGGG